MRWRAGQFAQPRIVTRTRRARAVRAQITAILVPYADAILTAAAADNDAVSQVGLPAFITDRRRRVPARPVIDKGGMGNRNFGFRVDMQSAAAAASMVFR